MTFEPEFRLAIECCRWGFRGGRTDAIPDLAKRVDSSRTVQIARFHRIQGLVFAAFTAARLVTTSRPRDLDGLADDALGIAGDNLRATAASRQLLQAFDRAGFPLLFIKGLTVGALAFGNPMVKSAIDIDILIDPADLRQASRLLRDCGFELAAPSSSAGDGKLEKWHRHWKESVWTSTSPALQLDLHTRLADNPRLIPHIDVHSSAQLVDVGNGLKLPTLADPELFAYLAVHGASSAWFRLKWIADFAGFLHRSDAGIEALYRRSQDLGAGRAAGQALLLADALFGSLESEPQLRQELVRDKATVRLFQIALQLVSGHGIEPTERRFGTWPIHRTQFELHPGAGFKLAELAGQIRRRVSRIS